MLALTLRISLADLQTNLNFLSSPSFQLFTHGFILLLKDLWVFIEACKVTGWDREDLGGPRSGKERGEK